MFEGYGEEAQTFITGLLLINTKQKRDMVQRGYKLNVTNRDYTTIGQTLDKFGKLSSEAVAVQTPNILTMGMKPDIQVGIINGWTTERFIFIIKTKTRRSDGSVFASYIQGYTDHVRADRHMNIDPNMKFFINSIINVVEHVIPGSNTVRHSPHSAYTLVYDRFTNTPEMQFNHDAFKLLRPVDALIELHTSEQYDDGIPVTYASGSVGPVVNTSKASNRIPSTQISNIINGVITSASITKVTNDIADIYMGGAGVVSEYNISDTPFMRALSVLYGTNAGEFIYSDLLSIDPNVERVKDIKWTIPDQVNINPQDIKGGQNILLTNDPESLGVTSPEARIASIIAETSSGLASNLMLTSIMFTIQSGIISVDPIFTPLNYNSEIPVLNPEMAVLEFERQFKTLVVPQITSGGMVAIDILVNIDLINESRVSVSVNSQQAVVFAIPTYSNSLFDPVITNQQGLEQGLRSYKSLLSMVVN